MSKSHTGPAVAQSNRSIRKIFRLAKASRRDIFYDLGCGRGQLCVVAVSEFNVGRGVGLERLRRRAQRARRFVRNRRLSRRIEIRNEEYQESKVGDATIAYNGLTEELEELEFYERNLRNGCKLVTLFLPLVGVLPDAADYPFYLMKKPFKKTRSMSKWIEAVLSKKATLNQFLQEIRDDPDYWTDLRVLKSLMRKRFDRKLPH